MTGENKSHLLAPMVPRVYAVFATHGATPRTHVIVGAVLLSTLALLIGHAAHYWFLTDDAFISFRYAVNFAEGRGLVFNTGEYVEGYTNFLWVLILGAFSFIGLEAHLVANPLLLIATVGLWATVAWYTAQALREDEHRLWIAVPCFLLAITRSVAVWSTSGLETRLFEFFVVAGCVSLISRVAAESRDGAGKAEPSFLLPAILFALAALTRPDGALFAVSCGFVAFVAVMARRRLGARHVKAGLVFVGIVGAHYLFRRGYYGEWLPNTYYVKVSGQDWSDFGRLFALAFSAEYFIYSWLPAIFASVWCHIRRGTWFIPLIVAAAIVPHAVYVIGIGGDHFEYRPFDVYFPLAFLLVGDGLRFMVRGFRSGLAVAAYAAFMVMALVAIPWQTHVESPSGYRPGFPGVSMGPAVGVVSYEEFANRSRNPFAFVPGMTWLQDEYQTRLWELTRSYVALRQEEHAAFAQEVIAEGKILGEAVERGLLSKDAYFAMDCVGAIPYFSDFRVLDRNGLTDHKVARSQVKRKMMAHAKSATKLDATARGVEFWMTGPFHSVYRDRDHRLPGLIKKCRKRGLKCFMARLDAEHLFFAELLQGYETTAERYPNLEFISVDHNDALERHFGVSW